jgi:hypothetical protein
MRTMRQAEAHATAAIARDCEKTISEKVSNDNGNNSVPIPN